MHPAKPSNDPSGTSHDSSCSRVSLVLFRRRLAACQSTSPRQRQTSPRRTVWRHRHLLCPFPVRWKANLDEASRHIPASSQILFSPIFRRFPPLFLSVFRLLDDPLYVSFVSSLPLLPLFFISLLSFSSLLHLFPLFFISSSIPFDLVLTSFSSLLRPFLSVHVHTAALSGGASTGLAAAISEAEFDTLPSFVKTQIEREYANEVLAALHQCIEDTQLSPKDVALTATQLQCVFNRQKATKRRGKENQQGPSRVETSG